MRDHGASPRGPAAHRASCPDLIPRAAARRLRVVILAAEFYPSLTRALVQGASAVLRRHGLPGTNIRVLRVPGTFELPVVAARVAASRPKPDAIIALGTLIRGQTPQHEVIAHAVAHGLTQVSVSSRIPVTFGVIVAHTRAQARARAGGLLGNRGEEAALAALEILQLFRRDRGHVQ